MHTVIRTYKVEVPTVCSSCEFNSLKRSKLLHLFPTDTLYYNILYYIISPLSFDDSAVCS